MTEELEVDKQERVFEDYKFVTRDDLEKSGLEALLGTEHLRPYSKF
jgi:ribosome biogenesis protein ENP2